MALTKEKRTKPCLNCKKSKVKCIYSDLLPCERCMKTGQSSSCQFVPKLPSLKFDANMPIQTALHQLPPLQTTYNPTQLTPMGTVISLQPHQAIIAPRQQQLPLPQPPIFTPLHLVSHAARPPAPAPAQAPNGGPPNHNNDESNSPDLWKNTMERQMSGFGDKLNDLTMLLRLNQAMLQQQQERQLAMEDYTLQSMRRSKVTQSSSISWKGDNFYRRSRSDSGSDDSCNVSDSDVHSNQEKRTLGLFRKNRQNRKRIKMSSHDRTRDSKSTQFLVNSVAVSIPDDFRDGFILLDEAQMLFDFFNNKISPQLFGFDVSKISVPEIWKTSPILICAICYISSIHYPGSDISRKLDTLGDYLHGLCREVLFKGRPKNEQEGFNTIMALIMCSFWLTDLQMFTGLALQVAKEVGLNKVPSNDNSSLNSSSKSGMSFQDRMKLWYLLYVLDGQQSITFNRQPLVDSHDYSLKNARGILAKSKPKEIHSKDHVDANLKREEDDLNNFNGQSKANSEANNMGSKTKITQFNRSTSKEHVIPDSTYTASYDDMRLVSQVEYNQAINEALTGNAWELLAPASFGIPSKSNLELDKWMVSWTVLLAPVTNGAVWSSKSTLIYYNFAKMHINSSAIRSLQFMASDSNSPLPKWDELLSNNKRQLEIPQIKNVDDDSDDEEDDGVEFISNQGLISTDQTEVNTKIATGAAKTVLNLVLSDRDIMDNLKYVPVHIHIMLYYAALLLINPKTPFNTDKWGDSDFRSVISDLWTVKKLQQNITFNLPTDKRFGYRLINTLDQLLEDRCRLLKEQVVKSKDSNLMTLQETSILLDMIQEVINHDISDSAVESVETDLQKGSRGTTPPIPEKIYAWPGSNHGHP